MSTKPLPIHQPIAIKVERQEGARLQASPPRSTVDSRTTALRALKSGFYPEVNYAASAIVQELERLVASGPCAREASELLELIDSAIAQGVLAQHVVAAKYEPCRAHFTCSAAANLSEGAQDALFLHVSMGDYRPTLLAFSVRATLMTFDPNSGQWTGPQKFEGTFDIVYDNGHLRPAPSLAPPGHRSVSAFPRSAFAPMPELQSELQGHHAEGQRELTLP